MSNITKRLRRKYATCLFFSILATFGPLAYYFATTFVLVDSVQKKAVLGLSMITCIVLTMINVVMKTQIRSPIFVIMLSICICADKLLPVLCMVSVGVILDELVFTPAKKHYYRRYSTNKELDRRFENV